MAKYYIVTNFLSQPMYYAGISCTTGRFKLTPKVENAWVFDGLPHSSWLKMISGNTWDIAVLTEDQDNASIWDRSKNCLCRADYEQCLLKGLLPYRWEKKEHREGEGVITDGKVVFPLIGEFWGPSTVHKASGFIIVGDNEWWKHTIGEKLGPFPYIKNTQNISKL